VPKNGRNHKYYEILGLKPGATEEQVKQARRKLAKVWHPDRFPDDSSLKEMAEEKLKEINFAYEYLKSHQYTPPPGEERPYSKKSTIRKMNLFEKRNQNLNTQVPLTRQPTRPIPFFQRFQSG